MRYLLTSDPALRRATTSVSDPQSCSVYEETYRVVVSMTAFGIEGIGKGHEVLSVGK
jgi:hypothetical protein